MPALGVETSAGNNNSFLELLFHHASIIIPLAASPSFRITSTINERLAYLLAALIFSISWKIGLLIEADKMSLCLG
jgi:hypothetical protein